MLTTKVMSEFANCSEVVTLIYFFLNVYSSYLRNYKEYFLGLMISGVPYRFRDTRVNVYFFIPDPKEIKC